MARPAKFTQQLVIQVTPEVKQWIENRAVEEQMSQADVGRELLDNALATMNGPTNHPR
jgi:hypothetical protein